MEVSIEYKWKFNTHKCATNAMASIWPIDPPCNGACISACDQIWWIPATLTHGQTWPLFESNWTNVQLMVSHQLMFSMCLYSLSITINRIVFKKRLTLECKRLTNMISH
jgi:hypothetical protein